MKQTITLVASMLFCVGVEAQFKIEPNADVFVRSPANATNNEHVLLYTNENFINDQGTLTLDQDGANAIGGLTEVIFDGDYNNASGTVVLNNNALRFGAGGANSTGNVTLTYNSSGETATRLVVNKTAGIATSAGTGFLDVLDTLRMDAGQLVGLDRVTLKSTATKTAVVGQSDDNAEASVTVERYYTAKRAFRFLSPSVTTTTTIHDNWQEGALSYIDDPNSGYGTHITGLAPAVDAEAVEDDDQIGGFDYTRSGDSSLFLFDNVNSAWMPFGIGLTYNNTNSTTINRSIPYRLMVRGDRTTDITKRDPAPTPTVIRTKGALEFGTYNFDGGGDNSFALNSATADAFSMLVNPYHSVVDFNDAAISGLTNQIYVWDPTINDRGAYVTVDYSNNSINNGSSESDKFIQPGQAFFVQGDDTADPKTLAFEEVDKSTGEPQTAKFSTVSMLRVHLEGQVSGEFINMDGASFVFSPSYQEGKDNWDAPRFPNPDEELSIVSHDPKGGSRKLMANYSPEPQDMKVFPLQIDKYRSSSYKFSFEKEFVNAEVVLEDTYTNEIVTVEPGVTYAFDVDENDPETTASTRFNLIFNPEPLSIQDNLTDADMTLYPMTLYPNPVRAEDAAVTLKFSSHTLTSNASYTIYDLVGKRVQSQPLSNSGNNEETIDVSTLSTGVYIIKVEDADSSWSRKIIKQ